MKHLIFISIIMCCSSCLHTGLDDNIRYVDPLLQPYLEKFKEEARLRNITLNYDEFTLAFGQLKDAEGKANWYTRTIIIDSTSEDWTTGKREQLVFHELGHLLLGRGHDNTMIEYLPKSIMAQQADPYYEGGYNFRREYYIDELFNPSTTPAEWFFKFTPPTKSSN